MKKVYGWVDWHKVYITSLRQEESLRIGTAFSERFMQLQNCKKAVKAVDYQDGYLCTGKFSSYHRVTYILVVMHFYSTIFITGKSKL